jgi:hypothetical protein
MAQFATYAAAVLHNALGRYDAAHEAAREAFAHDHLGYTPFVVPEVAEAAARTGDGALLKATGEWMSERTAVAPTDWALGIDARIRAFSSEGDAAERLYREVIGWSQTQRPYQARESLFVGLAGSPAAAALLGLAEIAQGRGDTASADALRERAGLALA